MKTVSDVSASATRSTVRGEISGDPEAGARNLLLDCVGLEPGQDILFVCEDSDLAHYHAGPGDVAMKIAAELGANVYQLQTPVIFGPEEFPAPLAGAMQHVDHTVFFSRIGDQMRFNKTPGRSTATMCYALDMELLGSRFCTVPHRLITKMADKLREKFAAGGEWHVTCPNGTDFRGDLKASPLAAPDPNAFTVKLFPMGILPPTPAATMNGVAASQWLQSTQNHAYEPEGMVLDAPVFVEIKDGRITGFSGREDLVDRVRAHYDYVAGLFDIDPDYVHSWHTGFHPKTFYNGNAADNLTRWGSVAFNSPRYTHLHTCGNYPPGEISLDIMDATISLGGEVLWQDGQFVFTKRPDVLALLDDFPGHEDAFEQVWEIGL